MKRILKYIYALPSLCFLGIVLWLCATNVGTVISYTWQALPSGYVEYTNHFEKNLSDYLVQKYQFVELNGGLFDMLGVNSLNEVKKLEQGHLTEEAQSYGFGDWEVEKLSTLTKALEDRETGYLYTVMPEKQQFYDARPMPGYSLPQGVPEALSRSLTEHGINNLNLDAWYRENGWDLDRTYFRTDHHWRAEAAFAASQQIMKFFEREYGVICNETMELENWNVDVYEDWFLGSYGRRTGVNYGGRDDLSYVYPAFETDTAVGRVDVAKTLHLNQQGSVYDLSQLERPGSFLDNNYCLYVGGNYPQMVVRNSKAPNDQKIIVAGDSMCLPVDCFLSTQFTELYHIDLRYYQEGTFLEYVEQIDPDLVVFVYIGTSGLAMDFGVESWQQNFAGKTPGNILRQEEKLKLPQAPSGNHYYLWEANMAPGSYRLTLEKASLNRNYEVNPESPGMFQQISLVDLKTNQTLCSRYFLADYEDVQQWLFRIPENPEASYALVVYNGFGGYTLGNEAELNGLTLAKYE